LYLEGRSLRRHTCLFHLCKHHLLRLLHRPWVYVGRFASCLLWNGPNLLRHDGKHLLLQLVHLQWDSNSLHHGRLSDKFDLPNGLRMHLAPRGWYLQRDCRRNLRHQYRSSRLSVEQRLHLVDHWHLHWDSDTL
jgi:hypothetical protein